MTNGNYFNHFSSSTYQLSSFLLIILFRVKRELIKASGAECVEVLDQIVIKATATTSK